MFKQVLEDLKNGSLKSVDKIDTIKLANKEATRLLNLRDWNPSDISIANQLLHISNILYNNTDHTVLLLDDGIYDLLLEKYKVYDNNFQVGAEPIQFNMSDRLIDKKEVKSKAPFMIVDKHDEMLYYDNFTKYNSEYDIHKRTPFYIKDESTKNMNLRAIAHSHPELVGTLDKCKFVLNKDARDHEVFDDPKVKVFERDFLSRHLMANIINEYDNFSMVGELKYDGVSVEATIQDGVIISAVSRGDTSADIATDFTPFLGGYVFPKAVNAGLKGTIGMKFEAIIMKPYMDTLDRVYGLKYANCRNAIIGITGRLDARAFRDMITLVPLKTDMMDPDEPDKHLHRLVEIEFMNKYFTREVDLKFAVFSGNYTQILYQVKKFTEEAEYMRSFMPFLYDGVVISYLDENTRNKLGRENSIDKYSMAIKFTPLKRYTMFLGYTYTIGMTGVITPMIHYQPVEFYGGIHTKSTGHSYARFKDLGLRMGDILEIEYANDVMPYVNKPDIEANRQNHNPVVPFITHCPYCGSPIVISETGKQARCINSMCNGRQISRITSMISRLGIVGFDEATISEIIDKLKVDSLRSLMKLKVDDVAFLGKVNSEKFISELEKVTNRPIRDYDIMSALGYTGISKTKWRTILQRVSFYQLFKWIVNKDDTSIIGNLMMIKGIGRSIANTIATESKFYFKDIKYIRSMKNIVISYGEGNRKKIRFSGVRPRELMKKLNAMGYDADEGSVTRDTSILIIPYRGFESTKTKKVKPPTQIVALADFEADMYAYLS